MSDNSGTAAFFAFDMEVAQLTHVLASEASQMLGKGVNAQVDTELPRSLAEIVGNTYTFQLNDFQLYFKPANLYNFRTEREFAPMPAFVIGRCTSP